MIPYDPSEPLISIHIEKTGGSSFRRNLEVWFGRKLYLHYPDPATGKRPEPVRLHTRLLRSPRRHLCIHGHFNRLAGFGIDTTYPSVRQFITWLRDPVEMHISLFSHQMRTQGYARYRNGDRHVRTTDIDEFFECARCPILRALPEPVTHDSLQDMIHRCFIHIGVLERATASLACIAAKLHHKPAVLPHENRSPRTQSPSASVVHRFQEMHTLEYALYEQAYAMNP